MTAMTTNHLDPRCTLESLDTFIVRRAILNSLTENLPRFDGVLLDIGCGFMPYKPLVLSAPSRVDRYIGLDLSENSYMKPDLEWDGKTIPLPDNTIDCAMATEVFEHCPNPEIVMNEANRVLKPNGILFFTVPFLWPLHDVPYDEYRYTPFSLKRHLINSGFADVDIHAIGGWDASLAQMLGLWVRRRSMGAKKRKVLSVLAKPVIQFLLTKDQPSTLFLSDCMLAGISGTACKPIK